MNGVVARICLATAVDGGEGDGLDWFGFGRVWVEGGATAAATGANGSTEGGGAGEEHAGDAGEEGGGG